LAGRRATCAGQPLYYDVDGRYKLYHVDSRIRVTALVTPMLPGSFVMFFIQRRGADGGRSPFDSDYRLTNEDGRSSFRYLMTRRGSYRVRVDAHRDGYIDHQTRWKYFRVTR
jgi:hypothetical protein